MHDHAGQVADPERMAGFSRGFSCEAGELGAIPAVRCGYPTLCALELVLVPTRDAFQPIARLCLSRKRADLNEIVALRLFFFEPGSGVRSLETAMRPRLAHAV